MTQKTILILLLSSISLNSSAQLFNSKKAKKARLAKADEVFNAQKYEEAIPLYLMILDKEDNYKAKVNLAKCYRILDNWQEAEYWYGQIAMLPDAPSIYLLYYGKALQANGKCDLAKEWFEEYTRREPDDFRGQLLAQACQKDEINPIFFCKNCYEITPLPFNTKYDDNSPVFYKNELIYTIEKYSPAGHFTGPQLEYFTQINQISIETLDEQNFEYTYGEPSIFLKDKDKSVGFPTFNNDYTQMYFTEQIHFENERPYYKIHSAQFVDSNWVYTGLLPFNSDEYSIIHPSLANDGQRIYFASDMLGGFGGMDLYYSNFIDNKWSNPVNLGSVVNTEGHDVFPYFHSDSDLLYFSSDSHFSNSGLDIYSTSPTENFSKITHLPAPINSKYDDHGIIFNKNQTFAYFASNRTGGQGSDDIYGIHINVVHIKMNIIDKKYQEVIPEVTILSNGIDGEFKSGKKGEILFSMNSDDCKTFIISKEGFQSVEKMICTKDLAKNSTLEIIIELIKEN